MRDVTICYGMTETSPVSFQTSPDGASGWAAGLGVESLRQLLTHAACCCLPGCPGLSCQAARVTSTACSLFSRPAGALLQIQRRRG